MTDDLKERLLELCNGHPNATIPWPHRVIHDALARITDLEAKLQRLGRELNLAKYGEPDFAWEIHKNAVADLEARLATAEADVNRLREGEARLSLLLNETALARDAAEAENIRLKRQVETLKTGWGIADRDRIKAEAGEDALAEALRERDGGVHDEDCRSHRLNMGMFAQSCNCGHEDALAALAAYEARRKG